MAEPIDQNLRPYKVKSSEYYFENNLSRVKVINLMFIIIIK